MIQETDQVSWPTNIKKKMGFLVYTVSCSLTGHCQEGILAVGMSCNGCCYCGEVAVEERLR